MDNKKVLKALIVATITWLAAFAAYIAADLWVWRKMNVLNALATSTSIFLITLFGLLWTTFRTKK
ncbi:MAG: hypothetical protein QHH18_02690 [Candidatus Bathyarchaeota archaeon]|jgi:hypothetical protein|nr:hypothetical protein [Candidatus Bathyarchaeota archaeon A05DMB-5]MDH7557502.1 hypothetical protein [Candidatus Bathyarchaeota archaeon]